jgi:hypothetical protein
MIKRMVGRSDVFIGPILARKASEGHGPESAETGFDRCIDIDASDQWVDASRVELKGRHLTR